MTFPTIPTEVDVRVRTTVQADTNAARFFPNLSTIISPAGDLLIAICVAYQTGTGTNAAFSGWTGGFTECHDTATSTTLAIGIAYKWSNGAEAGTFSVTQAGAITGHAAMILLSIPGAHLTTPPEAPSNMRANGTGGAADTGPLNPTAWDVEDTLWIAVAGSGETATAGAWTGITAGPAGWSDFVATTISADVIGGVQAAVAFLQSAAASADPGPFTVDLSNARNSAVMIAVRPKPFVATDHPGTISTNWGSWTATADGTVTPPAVDHPATIDTSWGTVSLTSTATVAHPATIATSWGTVSFTATATVGHPATIATNWGGWTATATATRETSATIATSWGGWTATATATRATPATIATNWGGWSATATGSVTTPATDHPATISSNWGSVTFTAAATVSVPEWPATITTNWGSWSATATATRATAATIATNWGTWLGVATGSVRGQISAIIFTNWGTWTATADAAVDHRAAIATSWGTVTFTATATVSVPEWPGSIDTNWGTWTATADASVDHRALIASDWGTWTATANGVVRGPISHTVLNEADAVYLGDEPVDRIYAGADLAWSSV